MATLLSTFRLVKSTITLFTLFNNLVTTESAVVFLEAVVFPLLHDSVEHGADVLDGARTELVVVVPVAAGGAGEHDVVPITAARTTRGGVVVRRTKVVPDLVGEGQLGDFGRDPGVVVDKGDDAGVERSLGSVVNTVHILCIRFVLFTNTSAGSTGGSHPGQTEGAAGEVSICEDIGETKVRVVSFTVEVEKVGHVNVVQAKWILWFDLAIGIIENFDSVDLECVTCMTISASTELCVSINSIHRFHMLSYQR